MFNFGKQLTLGDAITLQLVGHDGPRHILKSLQQPSKKSFGRASVSPSLNKDVEHDALLIHRAPKIVLYSTDPDEHLVHVPLVSWAWPAASRAAREGLTKLLAPLTNRLMGDNDPTFSEEQLDIPQAQTEHVIQPDSVADDLCQIASNSDPLFASNLDPLRGGLCR
jgi:hypothetical protein